MQLTEKENYLLMLRGEVPEWVPEYSYFKMPGLDPVTLLVEPEISNPHRANGRGLDAWGVNWVPAAEAAGGLIPEPNNFLLPDITKWRDVIKAPDTRGVDWETMVKRDLARTGINRENTCAALAPHFGYFQTIVSFMGFENALMAFYEEPDEMLELLDYIADFYQTVIVNYIDVLKPDVLTLMDDTAAWAAPFISPEMYREFILPKHKLFTDIGIERNLPLTMHNCGKCESIIDQLVEIGINLWEPAQTCNDLKRIKSERKIMLAGGWDARGRLLDADVSEDEIRQSVRDTFDLLAPGGGYAWFGGFMSATGDTRNDWKNAVLNDEVDTYRHSFYKR